jgi:hypothetical protein
VSRLTIVQKDEWKNEDQAILDFSDNAPLPGDKGLKSKYIPCKVGNCNGSVVSVY